METDLKRNIGVVTATAIVVANMIGAGIFTTSGIIAANLPDSGWLLFCWLLGGMIALSGALCYAELATRMPNEGGEYLYLKELYHPALGFLTGWTSFIVGFSVPIAASAIGFAMYFTSGMGFPEDSASHAMLIKRIAIGLIFTFIIIHYIVSERKQITV